MSRKRRHVWGIRGFTPLATGHFNAGSGRAHCAKLWQQERHRQRAALTNNRPDNQDHTGPAEPLAQGGSQAPDSEPTTHRKGSRSQGCIPDGSSVTTRTPGNP
jgi:hypothetical protein